MVARDHAHSSGRSRPSDKEAGAGGRVFGSSQPDPEMSTGHFGPQFAPKIGGPRPLSWIHHCTVVRGNL